MVFMIKSASNHVSIREQLRDTWTSMSYVGGALFSYFFVVGKSDPKTENLINEEHKRYGDLLQLDIPDQYQ